jgi:hypothetical protein
MSSWIRISWVNVKIVTTYKDEFKGNQSHCVSTNGFIALIFNMQIAIMFLWSL